MKLPRVTIALSSKAFWIACAAAVGLLLVLAALLFYPLMGKEKGHRKAIANMKLLIGQIDAGRADIPGEPAIASHHQRRDELTGDYRALLTDLQNNGGIFERWFMEIYRDKVNNMVTPNTFEQYYTTKKNYLKTALRQKVELGYPDIKNEMGTTTGGPTPTDDIGWETNIGAAPYTVLPKLQKRYWIREMVADAVLNGGARVTRLEDIYFPADTKDLLIEYKTANEGEFALIQRLKKEAMGGQWHEKQLPDNLGETITFGVSLQIYYADVPKFVSYLLSEAKPHIPEIKDDVYSGRKVEKPTIFLDLRGCSVKGASRGKNADPGTVQEEEKIANADNNAVLKDAREYIQAEFRPRPVRLILTCEALDFDSKAIGKKLKEMDENREAAQ